MLELTIDNTGNTIQSHDVPNECPICHKHIVPHPVYANQPKDTEQNDVEVIFKCANLKCSRMFIGLYRLTHIDIEEESHQLVQIGTALRNIFKPYDYIYSYPKSPKLQERNSKIEAISDMFYPIYEESLQAEVYELGEVAGVGFRKALEFLIKDYSILNNPDEEESIKKRPILQVINTYLEAPKVKSCAKKAIFLGNDEAHYVRKWEDKDIKDLKILIELTLHHIESELLTAQFEADMQ